MTLKKVEGVFLIQFACELLKLVSSSKPGYAPLIAENSLNVTFGFIVAHAHEEINILVFVLNFIFLLFYGVYLNTQHVVYLEFVNYQLGVRKNIPVFVKCNVFISAIQLFYIKHVQTVFQYQNNLYIFPIAGLAIFFILEPVLLRSEQVLG